MKVTLRHRLEYAFARSTMFGLCMLPEAVAYRGVAALGQLYFLCSRRRQRFALRFLRQAYPDSKTDKELLAIGRRSTGNFLKVSLDMVRVHRVLRRGALLDYVEATQMKELLAERGPILLVAAHLGSWEAGALATALVCGEVHVIVRLMKNPLLQGFLANTRRAAGLHLHSRRGGLRGLARALRNGAAAIQAIDQNQRLRGLFVPFFGKIASTERSAATLAVRQGYPVAVCRCPRVGSGFKFRLEVLEVFPEDEMGDTSDVPAAVRRLVCRINAVLERSILEYPEQYLWIHDRYRTQPDEGEEDVVPAPVSTGSAHRT